MQFRYLDGNQTWQNQWPPRDSAAAGEPVDAAGGRRDHHRVQGLGTRAAAGRGGRMSRRGVATHRARGASSGVALIIALILVALAAILATKLTFDGWLERRRTIGIMAAEQAFHFGMGAEALAADVLSQSCKACNRANGQSTNNAAGNAAARHTARAPPATATRSPWRKPWAQPTQPLPITPDDNPEGEPIGVLQGAIEDMQGRFNLNNLAHVIRRTASRRIRTAAAVSAAAGRGGSRAQMGGIARDWIDADDQPGEPDGAEDSVYTSQTPPYRTGNWPMMSPSELMNMPGLRRRPLPQDRPVRDRAADRHGDDQHLHRARHRPRKPRGESERRVLRPECSRAGARAAASPTSRHFTNVLGPTVAPASARCITDTSYVFSAHDPRHAWHYGIHLVQSFVSDGRRQGHAAAAHFRNTLETHAAHTTATPARTRPRGHRMAEHRRQPGRRRGPAARAA